MRRQMTTRRDFDTNRGLPIYDDVVRGSGGLYLFNNDTENPVYHRRLSLPGTSGSYASTPDSAALDITGDIDIRVNAAMDNWAPASQQIPLSKWDDPTPRAYFMRIITTGALQIVWSTNGGDAPTATSTVPTGFYGRSSHWIRATLDVDVGGTDKTATFYTSEDGSTWTQLGDAVTTAGTTSIFNSSAGLTIGGRSAGATDLFAGKVHRAQVYNGIAGTLVADFNADDATAADLSFVSRGTGETWTVNGTASIERVD